MGNTDKKKATVRLKKDELKEFRKLLLARRSQLKGDFDKLGSETLDHNSKDSSGDLSSMPLHMADVGTDSFEKDMTLGLIESEADELKEIEEALKRTDDGSYGLCEVCKKPIPKVRLRAIPYARLCIECKQKEESA